MTLDVDDILAAVRELTDTVSMLRVEDHGDSIRVVGIVTTYYCGVYPSRTWTDEIKVTFAKELRPSLEQIRDRIVSLARTIGDARQSSIYND